MLQGNTDRVLLGSIIQGVGGPRLETVGSIQDDIQVSDEIGDFTEEDDKVPQARRPADEDEAGAHG